MSGVRLPVVHSLVLAIVVVFVALAAVEPVWQVHDDVYYAMVAQGYGLVSSPSADIPFVHPLVGVLAQYVGQRSLLPGYLTVLYGGVWVALAAFLWVCLVRGSDLQSLVLVAISALPPLLIPQYTTVSGYLSVAGVAVAMHSLRCDRKSSCLAGLLLATVMWLAAGFLRLQMMLLALGVAFPLLAAMCSHLSAHGIRRFTALVAAIGGAVIANVALEPLFISDGIRSMHAVHNARVPFVDYGLVNVFSALKVIRPLPIESVELELLGMWFFADPALVNPARLQELAMDVPLILRLKWSVYGAVSHLKELPGMVYFWFLVALLSMAVGIEKRWPVLVSIALFVVAEIALALMGRPVPERVALGLATGMLALVAARPVTPGAFTASRVRAWASAAGQLFALVAAAVAMQGTYRTALNSEHPSLRLHLHSHSRNDVVYFAGGALPWRSLVRPLQSGQDSLPRLVSLGTFFDHPGAREAEKTLVCGSFMPCLLSGGRVKLYAHDKLVAAMGRYIDWKHARTLTTVERTPLEAGTTYFVLSTELKLQSASD